MLQLLWMVAVVWAGSTPADIPNPRDSNAWVTDAAQVIDAATEARMNARIDALHRSTDVEIAVVTVTDVAGTPKAFTTALFNLWGIGDAQTNNGVLIVLVMGQRRLEIEPGYGLEGTLTDGWLGAMQTQKMVPEFKAGRHGAGLEAGLVAIEDRLKGGGGIPDAPSSGSSQPSAPGSSGSIWAFLFSAVCLFGGLGLLVAVFLGWLWLRRRKERLCPQCQVDTLLLDEATDDAFLDAGQRAEEELKSIDWRVRLCQQCEDVRLFPKRRWLSFLVHCSSCGYRTTKEDRVTLSAATYSSTGLGRLTLTCQHCDFKESRTYVIPIRRRSSSSSSGGFSSGGGSFGGGSSGGGGAGSSW